MPVCEIGIFQELVVDEHGVPVWVIAQLLSKLEGQAALAAAAGASDRPPAEGLAALAIAVQCLQLLYAELERHGLLAVVKL